MDKRILEHYQKTGTYTYAGGFRPNNNVPANSGYIRYGDTYRGKVIRDGKDKLSGLYFYLEPSS